MMNNVLGSWRPLQDLLPKIIKWGLVIIIGLIVFSIVSGYVTFADIIKAVIIGLCVSTANYFSEQRLRPKLKVIEKTVNSSIDFLKKSDSVENGNKGYITIPVPKEGRK